ncbi:hypothetical protein CVT24_001754 [Panaeolus cyanescens]|uniref:Beta-mannosidase B n=1 Tax=Panaeolus cyanescens TaxID=181874 RepID=A0A409YUB4_9AGAR|nr:hypothetical protein CVT24_001754 [Panaeolus cyanescens]
MVFQSSLLEDWSFTQVGGGEGTKDGEWLQVSSFPTTVHVELLKLKRIPDPFVGLHEWDVQWVGEAEWAFKTTFVASDGDIASPNVDLVFDGLDTFATVKLVHNQFIAHRVDVKKTIKSGSNELYIHFDSAFLRGRDVEKSHEKLLLWNGDSSRLHVRKAQYNYGWDWGPVLMTTGPWKPVKFDVYQNRIADVDIRSDVSETLDVKLNAVLKTPAKTDGAYASFTLKRPDGSIEKVSEKINLGDGSATIDFEWKAGEIQLWYPVGYGSQPLYTVEIELKDKDGNVLDKKTERISFRRARIVQDKLIDQDGLTFLFEINNIRVFCGGSNWIPADSFLTTMTAERYRAWLQLLVDGNQNMIRIWGGGIYEYDVFYDICDELGILVWQDFMFGCGQYPAYDSFLDSVREEAVQNVKRLRHHPSIVIFAGNNEDYQIAESYKLELDYSDEKSDFRKTNFPARYIYERVLPQVVGENSNIYYHRGSPYSGFGKETTDRTYGDIHQCKGILISAPSITGLEETQQNDIPSQERIPTTTKPMASKGAWSFTSWRILSIRLKSKGESPAAMIAVVLGLMRIRSYVYYTQIMQAETLASAYRLWRRNWKGRGREYTAGALVWQINDCWPVTSWAIVDYFLRPKPAFFTVARELRPFTVGMTRKEKQTFANDRSAADFTIETILEIWATNSTLEPKQATLEITAFDLYSGWTEKSEREVTLAPNASTEIYSGSLPGQPIRRKKSDVPKVIIVSARLLEGQTVLGRYSNWPEPFKFIHFPPVQDLGLKVEVGNDGESVTLSTNKPIKGIVLDVEGEDVNWSDQAIDLVPGDPQTIRAVGLKGREIKLRFLGDGTA